MYIADYKETVFNDVNSRANFEKFGIVAEENIFDIDFDFDMNFEADIEETVD